MRPLIIAVSLSAGGCGNSATHPIRPASPSDYPSARPAIVIHDYRADLTGVHAANPTVKLTVGRDPDLASEPILLVDYPAPTDDPAGRDIGLDASTRDWTAGRAIAFRVKPAHPIKVSVSFLDRNGVAYTSWTELQGGVWQPVLVAFADIRPNPYFQPPGAKTGNPIDVSEVKWIGIAPQDRASGRLAISTIVLLPK